MSGFGKYGIGAFASGIAQGFLSGRRLAMDEANAKQRRELLDLEKPGLELRAGMARRRAAVLGIDLNAPAQTQKGDQRASAAPGAPATKLTPADSETAAEHLRQLGDKAVMANLPDDAAKYYGLANQIGKLSFDNQLNQAMRKSLSTNSPQPLADFFASQMPGDTATFEKAKDGIYTVSIWNPDKSLASRETFKNLDGVISHAMQLAGPQAYTAIQAGKLKARLEILKANTAATRAAAAQTSAEAATRRAAAEERRASAEEDRVHLLEEGAGGKGLTDAAKWNRDLKLGRITPKQYAEHMQLSSDKRTHQLIQEAISRYRAQYPEGAASVSPDGKLAPPLDKFIADYVAMRSGTKSSRAKPAIPDAKNPAEPLSADEFNSLPVGAVYVDPGDVKLHVKTAGARRDGGGIPLDQMNKGKAVFAGQPYASQVSSGKIGQGGGSSSRRLTPSPARSTSKPAPLPASKADLKAGVVYETVYGPAAWDGNLFHSVR